MFNHARMIAGQNKSIEQSTYDCNSSKNIFLLITFIYLIKSSGPEDVVRMGTNFTRMRTSDPVEARNTAETEQLVSNP